MLILTTDYLRLRKLGLSPLTAFKNTRKVITRLESVIIAVSLCVAAVWSLNTVYEAYQTRHDALSNKVSELSNTLVNKSGIINHYEQVLVNCLNGYGVVLDGRNMACSIKDYKEARS